VGPRPNNVLFLAAIIAISLVMLTRKASVVALRRQRYNNRGVSVIRNQRQDIILDVKGAINLLASIRGGDSSAVGVEIESSDEEETDDEEDLEAEGIPTLVKATQKAATKAVKSTVAAALKPKKKKNSGSLMKYFKIPYIIKASLNPIVFFQMTVGYWKSLYNINYMSEKEQDSSQNLRTALEQKARQGGGAKKRSRGKRKMKPGQAKTLSDLPQLNT